MPSTFTTKFSSSSVDGVSILIKSFQCIYSCTKLTVSNFVAVCIAILRCKFMSTLITMSLSLIDSRKANTSKYILRISNFLHMVEINTVPHPTEMIRNVALLNRSFNFGPQPGVSELISLIEENSITFFACCFSPEMTWSKIRSVFRYWTIVIDFGYEMVHSSCSCTRNSPPSSKRISVLPESFVVGLAVIKSFDGKATPVNLAGPIGFDWHGSIVAHGTCLVERSG